MVTKIGYFLSSEEFGPRELVEQARMARDAGFEALWISDHFHPGTTPKGRGFFEFYAKRILPQLSGGRS